MSPAIANDSAVTDEECAAQSRDLVDILNQHIRAAAIERKITVQLTPYDGSDSSDRNHTGIKFQQFHVTIIKKL